MSEEQAMKSEYQFAVITWLSVSWICEDCKEISNRSLDDLIRHNFVDECSKCEKAHSIKQPFK